MPLLRNTILFYLFFLAQIRVKILRTGEDDDDSCHRSRTWEQSFSHINKFNKKWQFYIMIY